MKLLLKTKLQKVDQGFFERDFVNYSVNFRTNIIQEKTYLLKPHLQTKT